MVHNISYFLKNLGKIELIRKNKPKII